MVFKEIAVYSDNHTELINTNISLLIIKYDGKYSYRSILRSSLTSEQHLNRV
jgi:hypothetical protein